MPPLVGVSAARRSPRDPSTRCGRERTPPKGPDTRVQRPTPNSGLGPGSNMARLCRQARQLSVGCFRKAPGRRDAKYAHRCHSQRRPRAATDRAPLRIDPKSAKEGPRGSSRPLSWALTANGHDLLEFSRGPRTSMPSSNCGSSVCLGGREPSWTNSEKRARANNTSRLSQSSSTLGRQLRRHPLRTSNRPPRPTSGNTPGAEA